LALVVDAADNAAQAALDAAERSFAGDLLREEMPANVRLVMLCRTERVELLDAPPRAVQVPLTGFSLDDTQAHLQVTFGDADAAQVREFHRMTGGNPRVQAFAIESAEGIDGCLAALGPVGSLGERPLDLDGLLSGRVAECRDLHPAAADGIDLICEAIAALRPRIPVHVLSKLCRVPEALIHSFVADLRRPLLVDGNSVQFRDEPTETWFRNHYRPTGDALAAFLNRLTPLAVSESYVAASLPELLWEAGKFDTLVELALTDSALPEGNNLEQRQIAQQRVQYALKAALREDRDLDASRLALKAGVLAAGHSRTLRLLRENTDLAGRFLDPRVIEDLIAARGLAADWRGSHLQFEGALLAAAPGQSDLALSRLRTARELLRALSRQTDDEHRHQVSTEDIAEVAFGLLNAAGVEACVGYLKQWKPNRAAFEAGRIIASRLVHAGRIDEWEELGNQAARGMKYLQLAVADAGWNGNLVCTLELARQLAVKLRRQQRAVSITWGGRYRDSSKAEAHLPAVVWIVAMGLRHDVLSTVEAERILALNLPPTLGRGSGSRLDDQLETHLAGFSLLSQVRRQPFDINEFSAADVVEARQKPPHTRYPALHNHDRNVVPLAPWVELWLDLLTCTCSDASTRYSELASTALRNHSDYETPHALIRGLAGTAARIMTFGSTNEMREQFLNWYRNNQRHIGYRTLVDVVRVLAPAADLAELTLTIANDLAQSLENVHMDAETKIEYMLGLSRALYRFDPEEAGEYFSRAITFADRIGDDAYARWHALLAIATAASDPQQPDQRRAYRVAQLIEGMEPYLGDNMNHADVLNMIGRMSATTATAVASRWRDRRFCSDRDVARALTADVSPLAPDPVSSLAMLPFEDHSNPLPALEHALRHRPDDANHIARVMGEALRVRPCSAESFASLDEVVDQLGITLDGTLLSRAERHIAPARRPYSYSSSLQDIPPDPERIERSRQARGRLATCDLTTVDGWIAAHALCRPATSPLSFDNVLDQAMGTPLPRLADSVAAFLDHPGLGLWEYQSMIKCLSALPLLTQAARTQLRRLVLQATARFCTDLTTKIYEPLDLKAIAASTGLREDLQRMALRHLGELPIPLDAEQCFYLASRLVARIPVTDARTVLDDLSAILDPVAPDTSGDGAFDALPPVPQGLTECFAGYLWTVLGDPEAETRWRAAHSVHLLIGLGCTAELDALNRFASESLNTEPFVDARFHFYDKHALLWLLIAIARAAHEPVNHPHLKIFVPLLTRMAFNDTPHVLMRASAASALIKLAESGATELDYEQKRRCTTMNQPVRTIIRPWDERRNRTNDLGKGVDTDDEPTENQFRFFLDFEDHWCDRVAEPFDMADKEVQRLASDVIVKRWRLPYRGKHDEDARHLYGAFEGRKTYNYKSDWPEAEDLSFYLGTHALWTVAADLIDHRPVYRESHDGPDPFTYWLSDLLPTRSDGRWLADRRDPAPSNVLTDRDDTVSPDWVWKLTRDNFVERLMDGNWITVWEDSDDRTREANQDVTVKSALVGPNRARALLLALQTASSCMTWCIPSSAEDDDHYGHQVTVPGFDLAGWIATSDSTRGIDNRDPLAADVRYPPPRPDKHTVGLLGLMPDADMRLWTRDGDPVFRSTVWDDRIEVGSGNRIGSAGTRLELRQDNLGDLIAATGRSLIVTVTIERTHNDHRRPYLHRRTDDDLPRLEPSFKVYIFDESGRGREL
jgi:hypothetical protein